MPILAELSPLLTAFFATVLLGFVLGLEVHRYRRTNHSDLGFGSTRTITLLALSGFVLAAIDPGLRLFVAGYIIVGILSAVYYWSRLQHNEQTLLPALIMLLTYPIGALALQHNQPLLILYVVIILLMLGEKPLIRHLSDQLRDGEAITLAKFLIMVGLILPMLPNQVITPSLAITWNQLWLAVVAVSSISYAGYLTQTYFLPQGGVILAGLLGGLYSSTAATVVLAREARQNPKAHLRPYASAVILASVMMYVRLLVLVATLGHANIAWRLLPPFVLAIVTALGFAWYFRPQKKSDTPSNQPVTPLHHPLEFSTAIIFAGLFVFFAFLTQIVISHFGSTGLHWLAFMVGFSDIDPFILSLLDGHFKITINSVVNAILIATASNNLLKAIYAVTITRQGNMLRAMLALCLVSALSLGYAWIA